jgi:hypothetical protein
LEFGTASQKKTAMKEVQHISFLKKRGGGGDAHMKSAQTTVVAATAARLTEESKVDSSSTTLTDQGSNEGSEECLSDKLSESSDNI